MNITKKYCIIETGGFARETLVCLLDYLTSKNIDYNNRIVFIENNKD